MPPTTAKGIGALLLQRRGWRSRKCCSKEEEEDFCLFIGFVAELLLAHSAFLLAFIFFFVGFVFSLSLARIPLRRTNPRRGENNCQHLVREKQTRTVCLCILLLKTWQLLAAGFYKNWALLPSETVRKRGDGSSSLVGSAPSSARWFFF